MLRHRTVGFIAVLALTLIVGAGVAMPALALESQGNVVVTASYPAVLEVTFPTTADFGTFDVLTAAHVASINIPFTVTSNLPYDTTFTATDYGTGGLVLGAGLLFYGDASNTAGSVVVAGSGQLTGIESLTGGIDVSHPDPFLKLSVPQYNPATASPKPGQLYVVLTFIVAQS
jgi:hypothetical protein